MDLPAILFALGTIPYFTSRLFAPAFWLALWANLQETGALEYLSTSWWIFEWRFTLDYPEWFASPPMVLTLLVLAVIETAADKNPDAAQFMMVLDSEAKAFGNFVFNNGVTISSSFVLAAAATSLADDPYPVLQAGFGSLGLAGLVGAGVWMFAKIRGALVGFFLEADEGDDLGLRKMLSWAEDGWVGVGTLLLVVLPVLSLVVSGLSLLLLFFVQRYLKAKEEKQKIACPHCGERNSAAAIQCFSCQQALPTTVKLGFFGQPKTEVATDLDQHRLDLLSRKRCLVCATRLPKKSLRQMCPSCKTEVFPSREWIDSYQKHVRSKLPRTLLLCLGLSFVPVLGLIPGIIYYRVSLISNLRRYIPGGTGCLLKWFVRLVNILLLAIQWIPGLGALSLPLMCLVNYLIYDRAIENAKAVSFAPRPRL